MADLAALLDKEASAEIEAILAEARERASAIVEEAEREAEAIVAARARQAQAQRESARVRARSAAQLEAASMRLNAQQEAIQSVFRAAESAITDLAADEARYATVLEALLREALDGVRGTPETVLVAPSDVAAATKAVAAVGADLPVEADPSVRAGVKVTTGRVSVENTLPARLDALRDELASEVADALTSKEA
jgi:V/A-type H+-transporting ATPase subunit E